MYIGLHLKYPLFGSEINETLLFSKNFRQMVKYQILRKFHAVGDELFRTDRRTDMTKLIAAFRNLENAPKNKSQDKRNKSKTP